MCLCVTHVPSSKKAGRVVKCWKALTKYSTACQYFTQYREFPVPFNGVLRPKKVLGKSPRWHMRVNGGAIHAYFSRTEAKDQHHVQYNFWDAVRYTTRSHTAYALWVIAYDSYQKHLCCEVLYVPDADTDEARRKRRLKLLKNPNVTDAQLRKEFLPQEVTRVSQPKRVVKPK